MKKVCLLLIGLLLCGCTSQETLETISDEIVAPVMAQPREISVRLPDNTLAPVLDSEAQQIYISEQYEIAIETLSAGDVNATVQNLSGYSKDQLTVMETQWEDITRYEFVWVSTGEQGDRLGRAVILDDGQYHYCLSVLRDAAETESCQVVWRDVFGSFTLT